MNYRLIKFISQQMSTAHEYGIYGLMTKCDELMIRKLNVQNSAEFFYLALLFDRSVLKEACYDFVTENLQEVEATDGWEQYEHFFVSKIGEISAIEGL